MVTNNQNMIYSDYKITDCSIYRNSIFDWSIPIFIFENHKYALPAWGTFCHENGIPMNLITFDRHNDTRAPFNRIICQKSGNPDDGIKNYYINEYLIDKKNKPDSFLFEDVFQITELVSNDEQIKTAYDFGYTKSYSVIHRESAEGFEEYDRRLGYHCTYYDYNNVDWDYLFKIDNPIALDFDPDYFARREDFNSEFIKRIERIIMKTAIITIARETIFFERGKEDADFSNNEALVKLISIIEKCIILKEKEGY